MSDELRDALYSAVKEAAPEGRLAVAFSGGVDSSLLAKICSDLGKKVTLLTVGFVGSHDIAFSRRIADELDLEHRIVELDSSGFERDLAHIRKTVGCDNTSHIENCIAYRNIARAAKDAGLTVVLSANGCDELFCGYNGYRAVYEKGKDAMIKFMEDKISNELVLVQEISQVAQECGVEVRQPFLSPAFIAFSKSIPLNQKIRGSDDMMRKHILRQVALAISVPEESAMKPKKALQYGSSIHKNFQKLR
jgi:asparagine synthase (glutamine-hydrolysing)